MKCKSKLEQYFQTNEVRYEVQHHRPTVTAQEVAESEHVPGKMVAKTVLFFVDGQEVVLALPASYRVDIAKAAAILGAKREARLASEEEMAEAFPDCEVGAIPPLGNLYGLPVYVDAALAEDRTIVFQAGTHTETMRVTYADFERLVKPTVAHFAHHA